MQFHYHNVSVPSPGALRQEFRHLPPIENYLLKRFAEDDRPHLYRKLHPEYLLWSGENHFSAYNGTAVIIDATVGPLPSLPDDPEVHDPKIHPLDGGERIYLHVCGLLKTCYLVLRDQENVSAFCLPDVLMTAMKKYYLRGLVGAKLVYKMPPMKAVEGFKYMVKLYFGKDVSWYAVRESLRNALGSSRIFETDLLSACVDAHSKYMIQKEFEALGTLSIPEQYKTHVQRGGKGGCFKYINVHYKDIEFDNFAGVPYSSDPIDAILANFLNRIQTRVLPQLGELAARFLLKHRLKKSSVSCWKSKWQQAGSLKYNGFKRIILKWCISKRMKHMRDKQICRSMMLSVLQPNERREDLLKQEDRFVADGVKFQYLLRTEIKRLWQQECKPLYLTKANEAVKLMRTNILTKVMRILCFDLETNYVPFSDVEQEVILAHFTLMHEGAHNMPLQHVTFHYVSPERQAGGYPLEHNYDHIVALVEQNMRTPEGMVYPHNLKKNITFEIRDFKSEKAMLQACLEYIRDINPNILAHYNGNAFDIPFLLGRCERLGVDGMKTYLLTGGNKRRTFPISFSKRYDEASVKYRPNYKMAESKLKKAGVRRYLEKEKLKHFHDLEPSMEDNNDNEDYIEADIRITNELDRKGKEYRPMADARDIDSLMFSHIASRDVMKNVPPIKPNPRDKLPIDKTLDCSAHYLLGLRKYDCKDVQYVNLAKTWRLGSKKQLATLIAYCITDVLIVAFLNQICLLNIAKCTMAATTCRTPREMDSTSETKKTTLTFMHARMWWENICSMDSGAYNSYEDRFWEPDYKFNADRDFSSLKLKAGRTISNVQGMYNDYFLAMFDFSSQYPSIMMSENICITSQISQSFIQEKGLRENVDFKALKIHNTHPTVIHDCQNNKCSMKESEDREKYGAKCKWRIEHVQCEYIAFFATTAYFQGMCGKMSRDLISMRNAYKRDMKEAIAAGDQTRTVIFNCRQDAAKRANNSIYGVLSNFSSVVAGAITQIGRDQNELASEYLFERMGPIAMADTDSTAPLLKNISLRSNPMTVLDQKFGRGEKSSPISQVVKRMIQSFAEPMKHLNGGLYWKAPANLLFEKLLVGMIFLQKKNYIALKLNPDASLEIHVAGLACKKTDRTELKSATQLPSAKMIWENDFEGLCLYANHLFTLAFVYLRAREIATMELSKLCDDIDISEGTDTLMQEKAREKLRKFEAENQFEDLLKRFGGHGLIQERYAMSREKANSIHNPKTMADKMEIIRCKRHGINIALANIFVSVYRNANVQVGAPLLALCNTLLVHPETDPKILATEELAYKRFMGLTDAEYDKEKAAKAKQAKKRAIQNQAVTPLTVTDMPERFKVRDTETFKPTPRERLLISRVSWQLKKAMKEMDAERKCKFERRYFSRPELLENPEELEKAKKKVDEMLSSFIPTAQHLPLFYYDIVYSRIKDIGVPEEWVFLAHREVCVDLWSWYLDSGCQKRYLLVRTTQPLSIKATDDRQDWEFFTSDMCYLFERNLKSLSVKEVIVYALDMREDYARQTRSTPLIVTAPNGAKQSLVNRGSYVDNARNTFGFEIPLTRMIELLKMEEKTEIAFRPRDTTVEVTFYEGGRIYESMSLPGFLRDDKRPMPRWLFDDDKGWRTVSCSTLHHKLTEKPSTSAALNKMTLSEYGDKFLHVVFNDSTKQLELSTETCPFPETVPFEKRAPKNLKRRMTPPKETESPKKARVSFSVQMSGLFEKYFQQTA